LKHKSFYTAVVLSATLTLTACSINFEALLSPFASDVNACEKLSDVIKNVGESDDSYALLLERIRREVIPLAEPELAESLRLLTRSASSINSDGSIFEGLGAALVSAEQLGIVLGRCIEVGVEVQYER